MTLLGEINLDMTLSGDKQNALFFALCTSLFYFVSFSDGRNWQQIELYLGEVIPKYVFLERNSTVTLYCGCNASIVRWKFQRHIYPSQSPTRLVSGRHVKRSKQLTLMNLQLEDSGLYYCSWTRGGSRFESSASAIRISRNYNDIFSVGKVAPSWVEVSKNSTVTLTCHSVIPTEWFSVHFQHQSKSIQGNFLTLFNLQEEHSGEYTCRGSYHAHRSHIIFHARSRIIVDSTLIRINNTRPSHLQTDVSALYFLDS